MLPSPATTFELEEVRDFWSLRTRGSSGFDLPIFTFQSWQAPAVPVQLVDGGLSVSLVALCRLPRPDAGPVPSVDSALTVEQLDEAWRDGVPSASLAQRLALCVLDAHGKAMAPDDVVAFVATRSQWNPLSVGSAKYWRCGAAVRVRDDGLRQLDPEHHALRSARQAVRERIEGTRRWAHMRTDPAGAAAN